MKKDSRASDKNGSVRPRRKKRGRRAAADAPAAPEGRTVQVKHDAAFPEAFCRFMLTKWARRRARLPARVPGLRYFQDRRARLGAAFPGACLIVPTGHEKTRANDTTYPFRPGSDFYYLTGNLEPDCVLALVPRRGGHDSVLFVEPNPGRTETTFFTDRIKGELWVGPRLGIPQSAHRFGVTACRPIAELEAFVRAQRAGPAPLHVVRDIDPELDAWLAAGPAAARRAQAAQDARLAEHLGAMRLIKDAHELRALTRACQSTRRGFEDVIERLAIARSEREVEGVFNLRARMEGNAVGYSTIAASGAHACVLHWSHNHGALQPRDLLLLDAGVEGNELYTADVTRTLPIGGTFTTAQRQVYELVLASQRAAFAAVRPGNDFLEPHRAAMRVLAHGLVQLGVLADAEDALRPEHQYYKRYTLHGVSHMLGLDVHDCAQARQEVYRWGRLQPGMVLTVEPGLYFQHDDQTVPKRLRGIGVRIEDDLVVTRGGYRILSDLPREAAEIERWMRDIWRRAGTGRGRAAGPRRQRARALE